jgi:hypothetical protein
MYEQFYIQYDFVSDKRHSAMGLDIEFEFADGRKREVHMCYSSFHNYEICAGGGKSHFQNMEDNDMSDADGEYTGDIVHIMYINCIKNHYITEEEFDNIKWLDFDIDEYEFNHVNINEADLPVKATFL